jgi:hypothetical protein
MQSVNLNNCVQTASANNSLMGLRGQTNPTKEDFKRY